MNNLEQALSYAAAGLPVFPCTKRKEPLINRGFKDASRNAAIITAWWRRWPNALIGAPTGPASSRNVLDVDVKDPKAYGFDTLADLAWAILPVTPIAHTVSGGIHLHFDAVVEIRNTAGKRGRGIGPGLDWRGIGGYVILPSPGSDYWWDPYCGPETPLASIPPELLPREPEAPKATATKPIQPCIGLSPYSDAALNSAVRKIRHAPNGEQEQTIMASVLRSAPSPAPVPFQRITPSIH